MMVEPGGYWLLGVAVPLTLTLSPNGGEGTAVGSSKVVEQKTVMGSRGKSGRGLPHSKTLRAHEAIECC
jgi:hypothetical protein